MSNPFFQQGDYIKSFLECLYFLLIIIVSFYLGVRCYAYLNNLGYLKILDEIGLSCEYSWLFPCRKLRFNYDVRNFPQIYLTPYNYDQVRRKISRNPTYKCKRKINNNDSLIFNTERFYLDSVGDYMLSWTCHVHSGAGKR